MVNTKTLNKYKCVLASFNSFIHHGRFDGNKYARNFIHSTKALAAKTPQNVVRYTNLKTFGTLTTAPDANPLSSSKATFLRANNNSDNFSIDVLYFVPENLKKVQESCWNFRIFAKVQVSERWRHILLGTLLRTLVQDFMFCSMWALHHHDVSQTMMTFCTTIWLSTPVCFSSCHKHCSTFVWYQFLQVWTTFFHVLS